MTFWTPEAQALLNAGSHGEQVEEMGHNRAFSATLPAVFQRTEQRTNAQPPLEGKTDGAVPADREPIAHYLVVRPKSSRTSGCLSLGRSTPTRYSANMSRVWTPPGVLFGMALLFPEKGITPAASNVSIVAT